MNRYSIFKSKRGGPVSNAGKYSGAKGPFTPSPTPGAAPGAAGGAAAAAAKTPFLQTIPGQAVMLIISFVLTQLLTQACAEDEAQAPIQAPVLPNTFQTCAERGGTLCAPNECQGTSITAEDISATLICCTVCGPPEGGSSARALAGNGGKTCAEQEGNKCQPTDQCVTFLQSSDESRCCKEECIRRIQTDITLPGFGEVTIEKRPNGQIIVLHGQNLPTVGRPNQETTTHEGNRVHKVTIANNDYRFRITASTETSISAEPVSE